ncbi:MAG: HEAT repeat domain-containing protein, partial [Candidatus Brocadiae bacterium]|nr:HEAT repeat domain-containing protein [Candidatus Brocadiia bacterium]
MNRFLCAAVLATILAACEKKHPPAGPPDSGAAPAPGRMAPPPGKGNIRPGTFIPWVEPGRSFDQWFADVRDGSRDAAWQGKFNLGQMRAEAAPRLAALLADPDPRTRIAAADAMTWMREAGAPHIEAIVRGLDDSERRVRFHAAGALKAMGSLAAPAAPAIVRHLMRGGGGNAHELSSTLVYNCGQDGEDALIAALGEDDFIGVLAAFESLDSWGRGSNDVAVSILDRALRLSPVPRIRRAAADALGVTQNDPALAAASLLHALLEDSHADVRAASARALALIARDDTTMVQPALRALGE